jgi:hypothetical protein
MRRTGVSNAITAGLIIVGIVIGAFGACVTIHHQTTTATATATSTEPTTITHFAYVLYASAFGVVASLAVIFIATIRLGKARPTELPE